ncbi:Eukaryotic porin/Tom40 [Cynara cardunculus var. scolymus]|uniref:Eukaryotic porin/Tom40 n=1 Tax=Cynara cardunculus var. scolymus TaxID=59895 RepID=A0A118JUQ7_CYNCS|nr:Eukaryotic porin/Tom40 [Cynara cardunculus var. scolymus]
MNTGPGLFSDIGKKAKDLLTRDYLTDQKISVSTSSVTGVHIKYGATHCSLGLGYVATVLRHTLQHKSSRGRKVVKAITSSATKKGGLSTGDVGAVYKYNNILVDIATTLTFTELVPSTKTIASFKVPDFNSAKVEVQYFHCHATLASAVALSQTPTIDVSATIGTPKFVIGAEAGYETSSGRLTKYTAGDTLRASYIHHLDQSKKTAAVGEIIRRFSLNDNTFTIGGSYAVDHLTVVKAKLNNQGKLGALLQHEIIPKSLVTLSSELDTKALDKTPKFGLALALKP